jgi:hypothetical protein
MRIASSLAASSLGVALAAGCGEGGSTPGGSHAGAPSGSQAGQQGLSGQGTGGAAAPQGGGNATAGSGVGGASSGGTGGSATSGAGGGGSAGAAGASMGAPCDAGNVCDGFEGTDFGAWTQNGDGGTIDLDQTHVFGGQQAVRFVSEPGGSKRTQLERSGAPIFPAMGNVFWGRVMAFANELPMKSDKEDKNVHYDLIQASGEQPGEYRVAGMGGVLLNYEPHDCYFGTQKPIPEDRWACWEWLFDGENNVIEFYIDGVQQARIEGTGQVNYQSKAETTTLWLDEFAVGPARIGCLEPGSATR